MDILNLCETCDHKAICKFKDEYINVQNTIRINVQHFPGEIKPFELVCANYLKT